jgi:fumarate hydratase subunit beta
MRDAISIATPLDDHVATRLRVGDRVLISGVVYTARDAAHQRLFDLIEAGRELPVDLRGQVIYYTGPTPAPPGRVIGSAGPTTASRMDDYTPALLAVGLKGMIGKGMRSREVIEAIRRHGAVYFAALGGAGALLAQHIKQAEVVAYEDLGAEAIRRLLLEDFPAMVANDCRGGDLYRDAARDFRDEGSWPTT